MIDPLTGAILPESGDADDVPAWFASIFETVGSHFVLRAADQAERNTKFGSVPPGTVVATLADKSLWMKSGSGSTSWEDVMYDTGWVTSGFAAGSGFSITDAKARRFGSVAQVSVKLSREGADLTTNASGIHAGNIAGDPTVIVVPAAFRPAEQMNMHWMSSYGMWGGRFTTAGNMSISDGHPGSALSTDDNIACDFTYFLG